MIQNFQVQKLLIAIAVRQQNPSILTADFLKYNKEASDEQIAAIAHK